MTAPILSPWSLVLGAVAHGALIGALDGVRFELPTQVLAVHLIFTTDAHITALTFELFKDSDERGRIWEAVIGMAAVAMALTAYSALLNRQAHEGPRSKRADKQHFSAKLDTDNAAELPGRRAERPGGEVRTLLRAASGLNAADGRTIRADLVGHRYTASIS